MNHTGTPTLPAKGLKAGKLFRKEEKGLLRSVKQQETQPFFSGNLSRKESTVLHDDQVIQSLFIPGIHLSPENDMVQSKCAECEQEEKSLQKKQEEKEMPGVIHRLCEDCASEINHQHKEEELQKKSASAEENKHATAKEIQSKEGSLTNAESGPSHLQRCSSCGSPFQVIQPALKVGSPDDPFEKEADRMAENVMRMPLHVFAGGNLSGTANGSPNLQRNEDEGSEEVQPKTLPGLQRSADGGMHTSPNFSARLRSGDGGSPLPVHVQENMGSAFQADFSPVRIHTGSTAASLSAEIGAQAFTYQNHIYFNENKYAPDSGEGRFLMAHELTHTIQQGAAKTVRRDPEEGTPPPEESWTDKLKNGAEYLLREVLPASVYNIYSKIKNGGLLNFIKSTLFDLFKTLFNIIGFSDAEILVIIQIFATLKDQMPAIIDGLSNGDCKPLFAALNLLTTVMGAIAGRVWDKLMETIEPIRQWLIKIWDTYISPAIDEITAFFGEQWEMIKALGKWIWDAFQPLIKSYKDAWDWLCTKLGFGASDEPGLIGFISDKLGEAWEAIKKELKPVIEPIQDVIEGIKSLIDMSAVKKLQEDAQKWLDEVAKTATAMGSDEDAVANKQLTLREVLLPALNNAIRKIKVTLQAAGDWVVEKVTNIADNVNGFITGIQGNSFVRPIYSLVQWVPKTINNIRDWANEKVNGLFEKLQSGVDYLKKFIDPIINMLEKIIKLVGNLLGYLPDFILGVPFMFMPRCIKDPIIKWLTEVVLKKIPIIAEFIELADKWEEIKTAALTVLKQVFVDGQLGKGLWTYLKTLLTILGIDPTLVTTVISKAANNFSAIISKPGDFLKNVWLVVKGGFKRFWDNILIHLPQGALDWLFGEVKGAVSVAPPKDFTIGSILGYVMDLFGITKENIYKRMELNPKIGPEKVAKIRAAENILTGALEWITVWIKEGPAGLLKKAKEKLNELTDTVINGIVSWISTKISAEIMERLATSSDPLGIGATINTIILVYDTIKTAVAYINRMLNIANQAMDNLADIIAGQVENAEKAFEKILAKAVPMVVGFAVEVIIGPVGEKIKEIVTDARKAVDDAIDWLINGALSMIETLVDAGKALVDKLVEWWKASKSFTAKDGKMHKIYIEGSETNHKIMVASKVTTFSDFINNIIADSDEKKQAKKDALEIAGEIDALPPYLKGSKTLTKEEKKIEFLKLKSQKEELLGKLSLPVALLMENADLPDGSYEHPIPIRWTKVGHIMTLYLYPITEKWLDKFGNKIIPGDLPPDREASFTGKTNLELPPSMTKSAPKKPGKDEKLYYADTKYLTIGVNSNNVPELHKKIRRKTEDTSTRSITMFRDTLLPNWGLKKDKDLQIDHVLDRQWGGRDNLENLWPLDKVMNNNVGNKINAQVVSYEDKDGKPAISKVQDLKDKWFIIDSIGDF